MKTFVKRIQPYLSTAFLFLFMLVLPALLVIAGRPNSIVRAETPVTPVTPPTTSTPTPTQTPTKVNCNDYTKNWSITSIIPSFTGRTYGFTIKGNFPHINDCGRRNQEGRIFSLVYAYKGNESKSYYTDYKDEVESVTDTQIVLLPKFAYTNGNWNFYVYFCYGQTTNGICTNGSSATGSTIVLTNSTTPTITPTPVPFYKPVITTESLPKGYRNQWYYTTIAGYEINYNANFTVDVKGLPWGLTSAYCSNFTSYTVRNFSCAILGRPLWKGTYWVNIQVKDNKGQTTTKVLPLVIK